MTAAVHRTVRHDLALLWHQIRYEQLSFWRNPQSAFFTFLFPVVIMAIFGLLFGDVDPTAFFGGLSAMQYYVCTIAGLSVLGSCYSQLAVVLSARRQYGILKRLRATPLPTSTYFAGLLAHCVLVSVVTVLLVVGIGALFGVPMPDPARWSAIAVVLVLGAAAFCALGVAVASLIRNAEAAPAVVQFVLFPLLFVSGTYMPVDSEVLGTISGALPVRPFNEALLGSLGHGTGFAWTSLGVLFCWGVAGAWVAIVRFRWDPRPE